MNKYPDPSELEELKNDSEVLVVSNLSEWDDWTPPDDDVCTIYYVLHLADNLASLYFVEGDGDRLEKLWEVPA